MTRSEEQAHPRAGRVRVVVAAAAAVAVAVAVPVALSWRDDEPAPPPQSTGGPVATPSASGPSRGTLSTDVPQDAEPPQVAYVADGAIVTPDGAHVPLEQDVSAVVAYGDGWLVAHRQDGQDVLTMLTAEGEPTRSFPGGPSLAVSATGVVATEDPRGQVMVGHPDADGFTTLNSPTAPQDVEVVAVTASGDCSARDATCAVYYNEHGDLAGGFRMRPSGPVWQYTRFRTIVSASAGGDVAGELAPDRGRRCTGVFDDRERRRWETCQHVLGDFSPDARLVVGLRTDARGTATRGLSVLDARTGAPVTDFAVDRGAPVQVEDAVWESSDSLLATVRIDGSRSLLRLTTDGGVSEVADLGSGDTRSPLTFALTP